MSEVRMNSTFLKDLEENCRDLFVNGKFDHSGLGEKFR